MAASQRLQLHNLWLSAIEIRQRAARFEAQFPDVYRTLRRMAFNNRPDVFESVERTKEEVDNLMAMNPYQSRESLRLTDVYRGTIKGYRTGAGDWGMSGMYSAS